MTVKVVLVARDPVALASVSAELPLADARMQFFTATGGLATFGDELLRHRPELAIFAAGDFAPGDMSSLENTNRACPRTATILVAADRSPDFLMSAMRAGVREVVPADAPKGTIREAFGRQLSRTSAAEAPARTGRTLAFLPAKGGSGSTFIATNVAHALSLQGQRTAVFDLNLQFGDALLFLSDHKPSMTIADVLRQIDRLDVAMLESSMTRINDRLFVLPAPESPETAVGVRADAVERMLRIARAHFDFVVLDMGRIIESVGVRALDTADDIHVVLQATMPFIHDAKRLMTLLSGIGYSREKIHLVLNRAHKGDEISEPEIEKALGAKVDVRLANSYQAVAYSVNHGVPVHEHAPRDPVARALRELATSYVPRDKKRERWFESIFG